MYPYLARIEVHLSSEPVRRAVDTVFIADGEVLEVSCIFLQYELYVVVADGPCAIL
jgi:hypothetical protein